MIADGLLRRLEGVTRTGPDCWKARCPSHPDRHPSLSIRETDDRVLVHCWAGCSVGDVLAAVGLEIATLFPPRTVHRGKSDRRPWPAADVLRALEREILIAAVAASWLGNGGKLSELDRERLIQSSERLTAAMRESGYA